MRRGGMARRQKHGIIDAMRTITATAPIRMCDCGGWTDTWFARYGSVFHIAVEPGVRVELRARPAFGDKNPVSVEAVNFGDRFSFVPGTRPWVKHPLIEAAIESVGVPPKTVVDVRVESTAEPGGSTGTSAAVCVALIGAFHRLLGIPATADAVAAAAHVIEVERLGQQSGVQDQLAAAHGGINFLYIRDYPSVTVHPLNVSFETRAALERQMLLVYLGRRHSSTAIHEAVVQDVAGAGSEHPALVRLRAAAAAARDAVLADDLPALGRAMCENTDAQGQLHPSLIGVDAQAVIEIARAHRALGWKVNGAGGEGGSVSVLSDAEPAMRDAIEDAIEAASPSYRVIPYRLAQAGLNVWEADPPRPEIRPLR
jgi:D-glycero-alpha-D-manno-heptose-7-phosphate kinase